MNVDWPRHVLLVFWIVFLCGCCDLCCQGRSCRHRHPVPVVQQPEHPDTGSALQSPEPASLLHWCWSIIMVACWFQFMCHIGTVWHPARHPQVQVHALSYDYDMIYGLWGQSHIWSHLHVLSTTLKCGPFLLSLGGQDHGWSKSAYGRSEHTTRRPLLLKKRLSCKSRP